MTTKRVRSDSPSYRDAVGDPKNENDDEKIENTEENSPPMPPLDKKNADQWLDAMEKWFEIKQITDDWVKFSLIATTQSPGEYAVLRSDVRDYPRENAYEVARRHIRRQYRRRRSSELLSNESPITSNEGESNDAAAAIPTPHATVSIRAPNIEATTNITMQSLNQLEEMLMSEIRAIKHDIAEIRALTPSNRARQRPRSSTRAPINSSNVSNRRENETSTSANDVPEVCWYHTTYGRHAKLCRSPCMHRA